MSTSASFSPTTACSLSFSKSHANRSLPDPHDLLMRSILSARRASFSLRKRANSASLACFCSSLRARRASRFMDRTERPSCVVD
ncbi:hypothetical protein T265_08941 [Opisthorchis viverrini]|uniref:Uncharacterized protein n=1 Tax=Opisthorchis viverrini TaxID=6198 RepID=A0A074ZIE5_OPIVI|nr:hypothetical protein T265_08941 [Opisthorchis viverrini]KER23085.1 hypothetical protein T265_08941 [Opisthorchis viverrini]